MQGRPVPREQFVEPGSRMIANAREDVGGPASGSMSLSRAVWMSV